MTKRPGALSRKRGTRRYEKLFLIVTEGACTESEYFEGCIQPLVSSIVKVSVLPGKRKTSPTQTLDRMKKHIAHSIRQKTLSKGDEAWIVVDVDTWPTDDLYKLLDWENEKETPLLARGVAITNPRFEYWLLLQFEDGSGLKSKDDLERRLKRHLPDYDKHIRNTVAFSLDRVQAAIRRAEARDKPREAFPQGNGSRVYRLVSTILRAGEPE